ALGPRKFGDVDESFDTGFDFDEGTVRQWVVNLALDLRAGRKALFDLVPGIVLGLLEAEGDALLVLVDIENHEVELLAYLEHFARVTKAAPRHFGDVQHAHHAIEVGARPAA